MKGRGWGGEEDKDREGGYHRFSGDRNGDGLDSESRIQS